MMIKLNDFVYNVTLFWIFYSVYINSWLPGSGFFLKSSSIVYVFLFFIVIIYRLNFSFLNSQLRNNINFNSIVIYLIIFLLCISVFKHNIQELTNFTYLFNTLALVSSVIYFFLIIPNYFYFKKHLFTNFLWFLNFLSTFIGILGIIILIFGIYPNINYKYTTASIFIHPNYAPPLYLIGFISSLYMLVSFKNNLPLIVSIYLKISIVTLFLSIFFTFSRNGIVAILLSFIFFAILQYRMKILYFMPLILTGGFYFAKTFILAKGFDSLNSRILLLIPAYQMLQEDKSRLLWGYGFSNNYEVYSKYKDVYSILEENVKNPHNSFISIILMFGIYISILVFFFLLVNFIKGLIIYFKHNTKKDDKLLMLYLLTMIFAMLSLGIFESQLVMIQFLNYQFLILFSGLLFKFSKIKDSLKITYL